MINNHCVFCGINRLNQKSINTFLYTSLYYKELNNSRSTCVFKAHISISLSFLLIETVEMKYKLKFMKKKFRIRYLQALIP